MTFFITLSVMFFITKKRIWLKAWFALIGLVILFSFVWVVIRSNSISPHWEAIFYTQSNGGFSPVFHGPYLTEEECKQKGQELLENKKFLIDNEYSPTTFFCGRNCLADAFIGSWSVYDLECDGDNAPKR